MSLSPLYADAMAFAARCHHGQFRKATEIPYVAHPIAVSALVLEYGGDEEQAIAALLHDVIEDCGISKAEIAGRYGERVAEIVVGCTDDTPQIGGRKAPWRQRKVTYLNHLMLTADKDTLLVSICDKVHNSEAICGDLRTIGDDVFARFTSGREGTRWYYAGLVASFTSRFGAHHPAVRRLTRAVEFMGAFGAQRGFRAA